MSAAHRRPGCKVTTPLQVYLPPEVLLGTPAEGDAAAAAQVLSRTSPALVVLLLICSLEGVLDRC